MKIGMSVWSFPNAWELSKIFETAKEAGFDGVEVVLTEYGEINLNSTAEDMEIIKAMADKCGISLYSLATGLHWKYPLTSDDEQVREKAKSIVKKQLELAKWLGCDTILVVPGVVGVDSAPDEVVEYDVVYDRALQAMNELKSYAEQKEVFIGIENVWNKFLLSPLEMRDFIDRIGSPFVAAYFDVGNVLYNGFLEHWIKILGSRIKKVHFKDFKRSVGNINGFVDILAGDVNYPAVMESLNKAGYHDGWVTAEVDVYKTFPEQGIRYTAGAMQKIVR